VALIKLLETGTKHLFSVGSKTDWGIDKGSTSDIESMISCLSSGYEGFEGENWLGKILMEIREELRDSSDQKYDITWDPICKDVGKIRILNL
jgi:predicted NAD-dependent protein-ADP-ribosyltransferase YbiA (DUF1768 family)